MLRMKSFLLAISLSPLLSIPFELSSQAQINSKNTPGTASGAGNNGSGGTVFSVPSSPSSPASPNVNVSPGGQVTVPPSVQSTVNSAAAEVISALSGGSGSEQTTSSVLNGGSLSPTAVSAAIANIRSVSAATSAVNSGGSFSFAVAVPNGSVQVSGSPSAGATIVFNSPNGPVTVAIPPGTPNPGPAVTAAISVLSAGGTQSQAAMAGSLAGATGNTRGAVKLVTALALIFQSGSRASITTPVKVSRENSSTLVATLDLNSSLIRGLNLDKDIALNKSSASVDVDSLNKAILAYNNLIDTSTSKAVSALAENAEFISIGKTLRKLRSAVVR